MHSKHKQSTFPIKKLKQAIHASPPNGLPLSRAAEGGVGCSGGLGRTTLTFVHD
jgi:hypothetical protein